MRFLKSKLAVLAILAGLQGSAQASLAHPVEYVGAGHTWLTLDETVGLSIDDILNGVGGWNTKYRFATAAEVQALLTSLGFEAHDYTTEHSGSLNFFSELGGVNPETVMNGGNVGVIGRTLDAWVSVYLTSDVGYALSPDCPANFDCNSAQVFYTAQPYDENNGATGNLLVRLPDQGTVPEPSSLALFGLASLVMAKRVRRAPK